MSDLESIKSVHTTMLKWIEKEQASELLRQSKTLLHLLQAEPKPKLHWLKNAKGLQ